MPEVWLTILEVLRNTNYNVVGRNIVNYKTYIKFDTAITFYSHGTAGHQSSIWAFTLKARLLAAKLRNLELMAVLM